MPFKSVEELDREISRLERAVDSGTMKLVDERKSLAEASTLRKQRKAFSGFDEAQQGIDELRNQISSLKKTLDNPQSRALSDRYTTIQTELDGIRAEQDAASASLNELRDERSRIQSQQREAFSSIRAIKDDFHRARRAYRDYRDQVARAQRERRKAEREAYEREQKKKAANRRLEEASQPAFADEILTAARLIRHFEPTYDFAVLGLAKDSQPGPSPYAAAVGRTVEAAPVPEGARAVRKEETGDDYFVGTGGKKGKKGRKAAESSQSPARGPADKDNKGAFNLSFGVIQDLTLIRVDPPMGQADVPAVVARLAGLVGDWQKQQKAKTEEVSVPPSSPPLATP